MRLPLFLLLTALTLTACGGGGSSTPNSPPASPPPPANSAPTAANVSLTIDEDTQGNGSISASDADGDTLTYSIEANVQNGALTLNDDGTFSYMPNADFFGSDSATITVSDGTDSTSMVINITINDVVDNSPPTAANVSLTINEDTQGNGSISASDADGDSLSYIIETNPQNGVLTLNDDGTFSYMPNADFFGSDSAKVLVSDGSESTTLDITLTIHPALGRVLETQCNGTTEVVTTADGSGGQTVQSTENSRECGYSPTNEYFSLAQTIDVMDEGIKERCKSRREEVESSTLNEGEYGAVFEQVFPADINNDNHKDFFVIYTCFSSTQLGDENNNHDTPHVSLVIPYVSNSNGIYSNQASQVFGSDFPELEAMSRRYAYADFNNDGREDYALAINWDDGRNNQEVPRQAVLMSQPNNQYKIDYITTRLPLMAHALSIATNASGGKDILWGAYSGGPDIHAWRYVDNEWVDVSSEYPNQTISSFNSSDFGTEFVAINKPNEQMNKIVSHFQITTSNEDGSCCQVQRFGLNLWDRTTDGQWRVIDQVYNDVHDYILWYDWVNLDYKPSAITLINGQETWISGVFSQQMCQFDDQGKQTVLAIRDATVMRDGGPFDRNEEYNGDHPDLISLKLFEIYDVSGDEFVLLDYEFRDALLEESGNYMQCRDINNDGLTDIVHETFSGSWRTGFNKARTPQVYINRGNQLLESINYDPENVLINDNNYWESLGNLYDLNGDGIEDLIKYSNYVNFPTDSETSIRIYYGKRNIN